MEITPRTRETFAWLAGILDGEGYIGRQSAGGYQLAVAQNSNSLTEPPEMLLRIKSILDCFSIHSGIRLINLKRLAVKFNHKPSWRLTVSSFEGVQAIVAFTWSWLGSVKKEQYKRTIKKG